MLVPVAEASSVAVRALRKAGVPTAHAHIQADLLIEAELRGLASHGLLRLNRIIERIANGVIDPDTTGQAVWRGSAALEVDGQMGLGPVVAVAALASLRARINDVGVALAAISNCNHLGMLGWYAEKMAADGLIAIVLSISEALVHPWGGRHAMIGTNPIAIGVPARPHPFVLDMATSIVPMGKIHDYAQRGEPIPAGWALDAEGEPTTDATAAKTGAIAPFGGAKGYALGLAFEILVAGLTACAMGTAVKGTLDSTAICNKGDVLLLIKPHQTSIGDALSDYLSAIRACPPMIEEANVLVPGDRAHRAREKSLRAGIEINATVWNQLRELV